MNINVKYDLVPYLQANPRPIQDDTTTYNEEKNLNNKLVKKGEVFDQSSGRLKYYVKNDDEIRLYNEKRMIQTQAFLAKGTLIDIYA